MMVCIKQHLVCEICLDTSLASCPLCREPVIRDKVLVGRERVKAMQLEELMGKRYDEKLA